MDKTTKELVADDIIVWAEGDRDVVVGVTPVPDSDMMCVAVMRNGQPTCFYAGEQAVHKVAR